MSQPGTVAFVVAAVSYNTYDEGKGGSAQSGRDRVG